MPYKIKGSVIYHKKAGKWKIKQRCSSVANAKKALRLLQGLESGSIKPSEVGKGKFAKKKTNKKKRRSRKIIGSAYKFSGLGVGGKPRRGKPKTQAERRKTHSARYGTSKLPPRGSGLRSKIRKQL